MKLVGWPGIVVELGTLVRAAAMDWLAKTGVLMDRCHDLDPREVEGGFAAESVVVPVAERSGSSNQSPSVLDVVVAGQRSLVAVLAAVGVADRGTWSSNCSSILVAVIHESPHGASSASHYDQRTSP